MYSCRFARKGQSRQRAALQEVAGAIGGYMRSAAVTEAVAPRSSDRPASCGACDCGTHPFQGGAGACPAQIGAPDTCLGEHLGLVPTAALLQIPACTILRVPTLADSKIAHSEHMQLCTRSRQLRHCENTRLTNDRFSIAVVVGAVQGVNAGIYKDADVLNSQSAGRPITYRFSPGSMPLCPISGMHLSR